MRFYTGINQLIFEDNAQYPSGTSLEKMQALERSAAGTPHVEDFAVRIKRRELVFADMSKNDYDALYDWFENIANGSKNSFYFEDEEMNISEVIFTSNKFDFQETYFHRYSGKLTLEFLN